MGKGGLLTPSIHMGSIPGIGLTNRVAASLIIQHALRPPTGLELQMMDLDMSWELR